MELLPEFAGCPNCGSNGKRWKHFGQDVCSECWLDVAMDLQAANFKGAAMAVKKQEPVIPKSSRSPLIRRNPGNGLTRRPGTSSRLGGGLDDLGKKGSRGLSVAERQARQCAEAQWEVELGEARARLSDEVQPVPRTSPPRNRWRAMTALLFGGPRTYNAVCLLCGRIWYGSRAERCKKCGGLCQQRTDHDLGLMGRHPQAMIEAGH